MEVSNDSLKEWSEPNYSVSDPSHDEVVSMASELLEHRQAPASTPVVPAKVEGILCVDPDTLASWSEDEVNAIKAAGYIIAPVQPGRITQIIK